MTENDPQSGQNGTLQQIFDKFKNTSKEVADKVEDTVEEVRNSEFGEKVATTAKAVGEKAKEMMQDVKESEFADKVGDFAGKMKGASGRALEKLGALAGIQALINAGKKLQETPEDTTVKENLLDELDRQVAAILADGVITPEEEAMIIKKAREVGVDVDAFMAEVRERLNKKA